MGRKSLSRITPDSDNVTLSVPIILDRSIRVTLHQVRMTHISSALMSDSPTSNTNMECHSVQYLELFSLDDDDD